MDIKVSKPTATPAALSPARSDRALGAALVLFVFLLAVKASLIGWYALGRHMNPLADVRGGGSLLILGYDAFLCLAFAAVVLVLLHLGRVHKVADVLLSRLAPATLYTAIVIFTIASFQITRIYRSPLDVSILRSGDDLLVIRDSIGAYLDPLPVVLLIGGLLAYPLLHGIFSRRLARRRWLRKPWAIWSVLGCIGTILPAAEYRGLQQVDTLGVKDNAVVFFIRYYEPPMGPIDIPHLLAELDQKLGDREAEVTHARSLVSRERNIPCDFPLPSVSARGMNVVLIQMESTTALQVDPQSCPNVTALASGGLQFRNHCTTFTETSRASYSVHYSDYMPDLGTQPSLIYGRPMPQTSLAEVLQAAGYRTGLFHTGFLDFMELRYYLKDKGFQTLVAARELKEKGLHIASPSGMREQDTLDVMERWIRDHRDERFFGVYMTQTPHHPYYCYSDDKPFDESTWLGRYRNSLHYTDAMVGRLMRFLRDEGLLERTLIVIYGDHGETISTYPVGHGISLSAEELMTPFIISNPQLFPKGSQSRIFTNHLDIAPSVVGLLGLPAPREWLGRDLFAASVPARILYSRVLHIKKTAAIDNGVMYALDERRGTGDFYEFHDGVMQPLSPSDTRHALDRDFVASIDLFRTWNVQHHLSRATRRAAPPPPGVQAELLHDAVP